MRAIGDSNPLWLGTFLNKVSPCRMLFGHVLLTMIANMVCLLYLRFVWNVTVMRSLFHCVSIMLFWFFVHAGKDHESSLWASQRIFQIFLVSCLLQSNFNFCCFSWSFISKSPSSARVICLLNAWLENRSVQIEPCSCNIVPSFSVTLFACCEEKYAVQVSEA